MTDLELNARKAKFASHKLQTLSSETKNNALLSVANALIEHKDEIISANKIDLENAIKAELSTPLVKRLKFDENKINDVVDGIRSLINLKDPVGELRLHTTLADNLELYRVTCPIGVVGVIFESRPDALVQIASLCIKSGNAVFLKGGSEAMLTNDILSKVIYQAGVDAGLPEGWLYLLTSRADVTGMLSLNQYIDLIIPRGSNAFVQYIMQNTTIAVLGHADGVCHTYIDDEADFDMALKVTLDAKTQYVSTCNTTETILINRSIADKMVPALTKKLNEAGVEMYIDGEDSLLTSLVDSSMVAGNVTNWHHEYLDMKVSIKLVDSLDEAIDHINQYGSGHTDAIITANKEKADKFQLAVDSGCVLVNCSTRFSDGFRFGFGAEVGVSTSKIHARGPVGLEGLMSYKYKLVGNGDTVGEFANKTKSFTHIYHKLGE